MSGVYQTFYDVSRFVLWADNPAEEGKRARFVLSFRDGNPRFVVYTGGMGKEGVINFPMDTIHLTTIMNYLKDIASGPADSRVDIDSLTTVYENDKPTKQKKVLSTLHVGKSKDGIVYLSVTSEARAKIIFPIKPSPFHTFRNANKEIIPDSGISKNMAIGIADVVLSTCSRMIMDYTKAEYDNGDRKPTSIKTLANSSGNSGGGKAAAPNFSDLDDIL